ncbi:MAG: helix-turn-helix transcriptional regulator [Clostridia bacterium]|nr:helix-turn-helix transcriptional regulator [Clostridia bacterium]
MLPYQFLTAAEAQAIRGKTPTEGEVLRLAEFFKIFGDSTRVRILCALRERELCVGDIAALLDMTPSAISHQLKVLKGAALVRYRREGKTLYYALADEHVHSITETGLEHIRE